MNACGASVRRVAMASAHPWRFCFLFLIPVVASASCAPSPNGSGAQRSVSPPTQITDFVIGIEQVGPVSPLGPEPAPESLVPDEQAKATASKQSISESALAPTESIDAGKDHQQTKRRSDGRPVWWIESAARERGEVRVAAEALGVDLRDARRAAIDAGLRLLEREFGSEPEDWVVEAVTIKPLRAVRGPDSVKRFVGYVLMSARRAPD